MPTVRTIFSLNGEAPGKRLPPRFAGLLLAGGVLMGLAPVNAWPLAWFALIPLWLLVMQSQLSIRATLIGSAVWGVAYHGTALSWIVWWLKPVAAMGVPLFAAVALALFAWAFITAWGAAIGLTWMTGMLLVKRWRGPTGWRQVLVGTALWCAVEWVWSRGPLYWTSLSYTQSPYNLVGLHLAQLAGPITVTAGIVAVNGCLAQWVWTRWGERKKTKDVRPLLLGGVLFVCIHLVGLGLYSLPLLDDPDSALSVGLVQGNVPTSEKLSAAGIRLSQQIYLEGYETLAADGADMVITPEGAIAQTWNASTQAYNPLMRSVVRNRVPLLLGTFAKVDMVNNQGKSTSSLLLLSSEDETPRGEATGEEVTGEEVTRGKVTGRYNKVKLVPLGEYWPLEKVLRAVAGSLLPWNSLAPGRFDQQLETPFGPVAAGLCYESAFAGLFRAQVARGGQAIFTASNNDPYPPRQMMQHHAQDVMRAVETDRWEVRVTNTGISGVVDPHGRTLWLSKPGERIVHNAPIALRQSRTPYVRWGDWLTPLLLIGSLVSIRPLPAKKGGSLS